MMKRFPRNATNALAIAALAVLAASCQPGDKAGDDKKAADKSATADAAVGEEGGLQIKGLKTEKEQASYMIGMDISRSLEQVKDEVDVDTIVKALETGMSGGDLLMTEEQATSVRESFAQKVQANKMAEMLAAAEKNKTDGEAFLAKNAKAPNVKVTESGLQYQVISEGKGAKPKASDTVRVHYKGTLLDGETFDSSYDRKEPVVFPLAQVVPGWQEGIAMMPVGSKYKFWIPSELGYGEQGTPGGPIGPNSVLVFEVELLDIVEPGAQPANQ